MTQKILAFVAKSFDPIDEIKIAPITKFLDSFSTLGFIPHSAERSEVESVSEKVRKLIDESHVLVGILTRRHPTYLFKGRWATAVSALRGSLKPEMWTAPPWVLQESGYALKGNKALILFREIDVEIPGLQGDLEYIPYDPKNPAPALQRASEMISTLIARTASISVETVVRSEIGEAKETAGAPAKVVTSEAKPDEDARPGMYPRLHEVWDAIFERDFETAKKKYEAGLKWVQENLPENETLWKSLYLRALFGEGNAEALGQLRQLAADNKSDPVPLSQLALCLTDLHEYDEALKLYARAASVAKLEKRAQFEVAAIEVLQKAKKFEEANRALIQLRSADYAKELKMQSQILQLLYSIEKERDAQSKSGDLFARFAIGELALHESPEAMGFRFTLGYDYQDADQNHLALYHYKILCEHDEKYASALNNLGVASSGSGLPILAAQHYKQAYELGDTLAASNLALRYLEAGFSEDATALLKDALGKEKCVADVSRSLAVVQEKIDANNREQENVLAKAEEHRSFLLAFGNGLLSPPPLSLDGRWKFPSEEIDLRFVYPILEGTKESRTAVSPDLGLAGIFPGHVPKSITRIETAKLSGVLSGRTCKFKLEVDKHDDPSGWRLLSGSASSSTVEGYILFAEDGQSGQVAELEDGKPGKYYEISKLGLANVS